MIVIGLAKIDKFIKKHSQSKNSLLVWIKLIKSNNYEHFSELKKTFGSADYTEPYIVFNIGGNKFRLIVIMVFEAKIAQVIKVMTHDEYTRWNKKRR